MPRDTRPSSRPDHRLPRPLLFLSLLSLPPLHRLSFQSLPHSCPLPKIGARPNSFPFIVFRALCKNTRGGHPPTSPRSLMTHKSANHHSQQNLPRCQYHSPSGRRCRFPVSDARSPHCLRPLGATPSRALPRLPGPMTPSSPPFLRTPPPSNPPPRSMTSSPLSSSISRTTASPRAAPPSSPTSPTSSSAPSLPSRRNSMRNRPTTQPLPPSSWTSPARSARRPTNPHDSCRASPPRPCRTHSSQPLCRCGQVAPPLRREIRYYFYA